MGWTAGEKVVGSGVGRKSGCVSWQWEPVCRWGVEGGSCKVEKEGVGGTRMEWRRMGECDGNGHRRRGQGRKR